MIRTQQGRQLQRQHQPPIRTSPASLLHQPVRRALTASAHRRESDTTPATHRRTKYSPEAWTTYPGVG